MGKGKIDHAKLTEEAWVIRGGRDRLRAAINIQLIGKTRTNSVNKDGVWLRRLPRMSFLFFHALQASTSDAGGRRR
jgi:hypothetical protein